MEVWLSDLTAGLAVQLTQTDCGPRSIGYIPEWFVPGVQRFQWSPDGQRIAYLTMCSSTDPAQLHLYELKANHSSLIAEGVDATGDFGWAPSGRQLVFSSITQETIYAVEILDASRFQVEILTRTLAAFPTWSPNGKYIAYRGPEVGLPGTGSRTYLSVVDSDWHHLVYDPPPQPTGPGFPDSRNEWIVAPVSGGLVWSHNSRYLAVASVREYVPGSVILVEVAGQIAHKRSGVSQSSDSLGPDFYHPIFSPDDETLYFVSARPAAEYGRPFGSIYSVSVQDLIESSFPNIQLISPEGSLAGFPSLSPDGQWFLYVLKVDGASEIWLQAVKGAHRQRLVGDGFLNIQPIWRPCP